MTTVDERLSTAYHEAGHAVIARHMGVAVRKVTIIEDETATGRTQHVAFRTDWWFTELETSSLETMSLETMSCRARRRLEARIMVLWAGTLAEQIYAEKTVEDAAVGFGFDAESNSAGSGSDMDQLADYLVRLFGDQEEGEVYMRWLELRTRNLLGSPMIRVQVEAVAQELLAQHTLSGKTLKSVYMRAVQAAVDAFSQGEARR